MRLLRRKPRCDERSSCREGGGPERGEGPETTAARRPRRAIRRLRRRDGDAEKREGGPCEPRNLPEPVDRCMNEPVGERDQRDRTDRARQPAGTTSASPCASRRDEEAEEEHCADDACLRQELQFEAVRIERLLVGTPVTEIVDCEVVRSHAV